jgi:kumamolisin
MNADAPRPINPADRVEVSMLVRPRRPLQELNAQLEHPLTREEFAAKYGADAADLHRVSAFAGQHGLEVVEASPARRTVLVAGRATDVARAFGIQFQNQRAGDGTVYRTPDRPAQLPPELQGIVEGVFGLDTRRVAEHHER